MLKKIEKKLTEIDKNIARRFRDPELEQKRIISMLEFEKRLWNRDLKLLAGVDEVGRGPLAGPVVSAAVIFPEDIYIPGIDDSKRLTARQRTYLVPLIKEKALATGIGIVDSEIIDEMNIRRATHLSMIEAIDNLGLKVDHVLVDGLGIANLPLTQTAIAGGDAKCYSIAAASILAKVYRDNMMIEFDKIYPEYGFAGHKGYGSQAHCAAISQYGPCPIHRRSFSWGGRA
ncbi:ribonuclease HII [bacterium]|nr:ribonuclease HII [bacterium]